MHVLILPSWYPDHPVDINGVFFRDQARALAAKGHKVGVISVNLRSVSTLLKGKKGKPAPFFEIDDGVLTYRDQVWKLVSRIPYGKYWLWRFGANRTLKRYIKEHGMPDIIHAHSAIYAGKVAAEWRARFAVPVVLTEHSTRFAGRKLKGWQLGLADEAFRGVDARVAVSPPLGELLSREMGEQENSWRWIPNMVASRFSGVASDVAKQPEHPPRLLNLAMMAEKKGQFDLLDAFGMAFPEPSQVVLWLGGDGPVRQRLEEKANALGLSDRICFLGKVAPQDVPALFAQVDMFVLSSHYETFGVVVAEALTSGVPVVATRCGGPESIILEGDGALVEPGSPDELARALKETFNQLENFDRAAIRERALRRFSGAAVTEQLEALYQEVLAAVRAQ